MVKRYDCQGAVVTHAEGPFVLYEDYAALEAEHQKLLDAVIQYGHDPETLMELFKV